MDSAQRELCRRVLLCWVCVFRKFLSRGGPHKFIPGYEICLAVIILAEPIAQNSMSTCIMEQGQSEGF